MFFDIFKSLCDENGISCKRAVLEIGLSHSIPTKWKKTGATPKGETLKLIADYFNVSTDYLLGETDDPINYDDPELIASLDQHVLAMFNGDTKKAVEHQKIVDNDAKREMEEQAKEDIAKVALFGGEKDVPEEVWQAVQQFAKFTLEQYKKGEK